MAKLNHDGVGIQEDWLRRIGPAYFSHITFWGTFRRRDLDPEDAAAVRGTFAM